MVKSPRVKHSSTKSEPVTIDLDPKDVSREAPDAAGPVPEGGMSAAEASETGASVKADAEPEVPAAETPGGAMPHESEADTRLHAASSTTGFGRDPSPAAPRRSENRLFAPLAAGVAGGLAVLLVGGLIQWSAGGRDGDVAFTELEAEIASLRQTVDALPAPGDDGRLDALSAEIEALRGEIGTGGGVDPAALEERLAALEQAIADAGPAETPEAALTALEGRLSALEQGGATGDLEERLAALEGTMGDVSQQVEEQAGQPATALIIAASALKAAIDRGQPFMAELETYAALDPDAPQVAALRDLAAAGVPTRADIASAAGEAAPAMVAADRPVDPNAGFWDRIVQSAQDMVVVRPVGAIEGEGTPAVVARIEAAVEAGDYDTALAEYDLLPEAAQAAGADFVAMVRARQTADRLIEEALSAALNQA